MDYIFVYCEKDKEIAKEINKTLLKFGLNGCFFYEEVNSDCQSKFKFFLVTNSVENDCHDFKKFKNEALANRAIIIPIL